MDNPNARIEADREIDASESTPTREATEGSTPAQPQAEASEPVRTAKAKPAKGKKAAETDDKKDVLAGLSPERRITVLEAEAAMHSIGRKTTEAAFQLGDQLVVIKECYPEEAEWKDWVKTRGGMNMRTAENYLGLPTRLGTFRERLITCAVPSTVCYGLANVDPAVVEDIVGRYENGPRPTLAEVRAIANGSASAEPDVAIDPADVGGLAGLRALGIGKAKSGTKVVGERVAGILDRIDPALERHWRGKRVAKADLAKAIVYEARRASSELQNVAVFVEPNDYGPVWNVNPISFPVDSGWRKVSDILYTLGGIESWPASDKVGTWLVDEVIPTLEWAIGRKPKAEKGAEPEAETATGAKPAKGRMTTPKRATAKSRSTAKPKQEEPGQAAA